MKTSLTALTSFATLTGAARLLLQIPNTALVNPSTLPSTTHATLQSSGEPLDAYLTRSNTFNFNNVSVGSYLATVHCRDYAFEPMRIDITLEEAVEGSGEKKERISAWQTFLGNEWDNKGESRGEGGNGLVIDARPIMAKYYYQERQGCKCCSHEEAKQIESLTFSSFPAVIPEEPYDPHGYSFHGTNLWNAQVDGEQ
jgi:hypothetical protein